ncbi:conjugal transfer protein traD [Photobacterium indicum]|uniref:conjugal transfer protein traD n=1 Tax=Photobacterium indicum TaxID=81447 RepID=UPI003D137009
MSKQPLQAYASYNVMARKALIGGVPIILLVATMGVMLITGFAGVLWLGFGLGMIIPSVLALGLFIVRVRCMDNSRAMDALQWELKGVWGRIRCRSSVTSFTSTNNATAKRKAHALEWFKNNTVN